MVAPEAYTEHPNWPANYGAYYVSQILDILTANPEVWSKTALLITYDENDGFFDHMVPPTPPQTAAQGQSTVSIENEIFPGSTEYVAGPYGLGARVPMLVVSPWSKGGWVNSQLFDHTSIIRFIEQRFGPNNPALVEANITPWRRTVAGDLTTAFDFRTPNDALPTLPGTASYAPPDALRHADYVPLPPVSQSLPRQEPGFRRARALPYRMQVTGTSNLAAATFGIDFGNPGSVGLVYQVRSGKLGEVPRNYTVEPGKQLSDTLAGGGRRPVRPHGPWPERLPGAPSAAASRASPAPTSRCRAARMRRTAAHPAGDQPRPVHRAALGRRRLYAAVGAIQPEAGRVAEPSAHRRRTCSDGTT